MNTDEPKNPLIIAQEAKKTQSRLLTFNILGAFPAIYFLFQSPDNLVVWSLGVLSWGYYFVMRRNAKKIPYFQELGELVALREKAVQLDYQVRWREINWQKEMRLLTEKVSNLEKGWGLRMEFAWDVDADLYELYLDGKPAPCGFIQDAKAVFSDNTNEQTFAVGSTSTTVYNSAKNNRILNSTTSTTNQMLTTQTGTASVQIEGPQMVPGVLLFDSPYAAREFTNMFNSAAKNAAAASANLQSSLKEALKKLEQLKSPENTDFGASEIQQMLAQYPKPVLDWIGVDISRWNRVDSNNPNALSNK